MAYRIFKYSGASRTKENALESFFKTCSITVVDLIFTNDYFYQVKHIQLCAFSVYGPV